MKLCDDVEEDLNSITLNKIIQSRMQRLHHQKNHNILYRFL
jgi:hypothetical protein